MVDLVRHSSCFPRRYMTGPLYFSAAMMTSRKLKHSMLPRTEETKAHNAQDWKKVNSSNTLRSNLEILGLWSPKPEGLQLQCYKRYNWWFNFLHCHYLTKRFKAYSFAWFDAKAVAWLGKCISSSANRLINTTLFMVLLWFWLLFRCRPGLYYWCYSIWLIQVSHVVW